MHNIGKSERLTSIHKASEKQRQGEKTDATILEVNRGMTENYTWWWSPRVKDNSNNKGSDNWCVDWFLTEFYAESPTVWAYQAMCGPGTTQFCPVLLRAQCFGTVAVGYFPGCYK